MGNSAGPAQQASLCLKLVQDSWLQQFRLLFPSGSLLGPVSHKKKRDAWLGAYHAHYLARKEIAKLDNACFVLEDDCKLLGNRDMPQATDLPTDVVLFLGCWITGRPVLRANDRSCFFGADGFLKQLTLMPLKSSIAPKRAAASRPASCKGGGELRVN